jgi:predicted SprT family Zn-dependent metalloprotease
MNLYEASHLARSLMTEHGLAHWSFSFDHARRRFGRCDYTNRRITLSKTLTFLNPLDEVRDTLLHEIAHALAPGANHGPRWRAMCLKIGARPVRCYTDEKVVSPPRRPPAWLFGCPACNWWVERRRASRRKYLCTKCRGTVVFRAHLGQPQSDLRGG